MQCSILTALTFNWRPTVKDTHNREFLYYTTGEKSSERKEERKNRRKEKKKKSKIERQNGVRIKLYLGGLRGPHWVIIASVSMNVTWQFPQSNEI